jgi:hypothetical protein
MPSITAAFFLFRSPDDNASGAIQCAGPKLLPLDCTNASWPAAGQSAPSECLLDTGSVCTKTVSFASRRKESSFLIFHVGTLSQALMDEAEKSRWTVISMKNDSKQICAFEK